MTARHHHYLSQCYLRGFTEGCSKNSKLTVFDHLANKVYETRPRNVGGIRDFNRIDTEGVDQNVLEHTLAEFESNAAKALRNIEEGASFEGDNKELILYLAALIGTRSPARREHWRRFQAQVMEQVMGLTLASRERYESQVRQMRKTGREMDDSVGYEDVKKFFESKEYRIEVAREHHIHMEFVGVQAIFPLLLSRNWMIVKATVESGPFISSDNPVGLVWNDPDSIPPFYRNSPGYGLKDTRVFFPLSKSTALVGEFDGKEGIIRGNRELIASINTFTLAHSKKQIYAPKLGFYYLNESQLLCDGKHLRKHFKF